MSPLILLKMAVQPLSVEHKTSTLSPQVQHPVAGPPSSARPWWRRLLYGLLLLCNVPLLLMVAGTLTVPALSMLGILLSSLKVGQLPWLLPSLTALIALYR